MATLTCNPDRAGGGTTLAFTHQIFQPIVLPDEADGASLHAAGIYVGASPSLMRIGVYAGQTPATGPQNATLVQDLGVLSPDGPGWVYGSSTELPELTAGQTYWVAVSYIKREVPISDDSAHRGAFHSEGMWLGQVDQDETVPWPSTWVFTQPQAGTFASVRLIYGFPADPDADRTIKLELWSDVESNGGSVQARIPRLGEGSTVERSLRNDGSLIIRAPLDDAWVSSAETGKVIRLIDSVLGADAGERDLPTDTEEWRVRRVQSFDGRGAADVEIEAVPIIQDLTHVGMVYELTTDGRPNFQIGDVETTLQGAWDDYIEPMLDDQSITSWRAEFSAHAPVEVSINSITPLGLLTTIAEAARVDIWAQHDGANPIRLLSGLRGFEDGVDSLTRRLNLSVDGWRVTRLGLGEDAERLGTVAQAVRGAQGGASVSLGLYGLVLEVTGVNGSDITVVDPEEGIDPQRASFIRFQDQLGGASSTYPNHYLRKTDGSLTEITDTVVTASATTLTVDDATNISTGDLVEIRRSSSDDPPLEAVNPALLKTYGRSTVALTGQRGEGRNYADNPQFFRDFAFAGAPTLAQVAKVDSYDSGAPSLTIKEFEGASTTIEDGSIIYAVGSLGAGVVDGDHTWPGSGTLEIAIVQAFGAPASDNKVIIWRPISIDGWQRIGGGSVDPTIRVPVGAKMSLGSGSWTANVKTAATLNVLSSTTGDTNWLELKNFTGQALQAGDVIVDDTSGDQLVVLGRAEIDASEDISVPVVPLQSSSWAADDAVTITRPSWAQGYEGDRLCMPFGFVGVGGINQDHGWISEAVRVPFVDGWELRVFAKFAAYNPWDTDFTVTPSSTRKGLSVYLDEGANPGTPVITAEDSERTYTSGELAVVELTGDHTPSSEATYRVRVEAPLDTSGPIDFRLIFVPLEVSVSYGPSAYTLTHTEYSGTNKLYAKMLSLLNGLRHGRQIQAEIRDVAYETGSDVRREKVVLGAPWYITSERLGLEAYPDDIEGGIARVHRYRQDLRRPTRSSVVLDTDLFYLTRET